MTLFVAIWGAVLGTVTFAWNVWKWRRESPRVVASIEAVKSLWDEKRYARIRLALRNRGGKKTTVEEIFLCRRPEWQQHGLWAILYWIRREVDWQQNVGISNHKTAKLPAVLDVNEVWEGFIPLELDDPDDDEEQNQIHLNREILGILNKGKLRYSIQCSHTNRRIRGVVRDEDDLIRE